MPCNKFRSETNIKPKKNNLDCTVDPKFGSIDGLFKILFKISDPTKKSFDKYYMLLLV